MFSLPQGYDQLVRHSLSKSHIAGAFQFCIEDNTKLLSPTGKWLLEYFTNIRASYLQLPYGDQALFMKRETFEKNGGFPKLEFMEDFEMVSRLRKQGKIDIVNVPAITSGRRWKQLGLLRTTVVNQCIITAYMFGVKPATLYRIYYKKPLLYLTFCK